ncbi:Flp family type IVb pilin [Phosphitispora sp. TUW77]|uniref:Flp family type IVb pilin n=1 Tax=Phosphitispora sp. TUW77 TaxID=3152361 RepID=UPI003AB912BB
MKLIVRLFSENSGQGLTEYGLVLGLLVVAAAGGLLLAGQKVAQLYIDSNATMP